MLDLLASCAFRMCAIDMPDVIGERVAMPLVLLPVSIGAYENVGLMLKTNGRNGGIGAGLGASNFGVGRTGSTLSALVGDVMSMYATGGCRWAALRPLIEWMLLMGQISMGGDLQPDRSSAPLVSQRLCDVFTSGGSISVDDDDADDDAAVERVGDAFLCILRIFDNEMVGGIGRELRTSDGTVVLGGNCVDM